MTYRQLTSDDRYKLAALRWQGFSPAEIAQQIGRHRSTIGREIRRNSMAHDGRYRAAKAIEKTNGRRSRSRRNRRFTNAEFHQVQRLLTKKWSPEQISGWLALHGHFNISHETIYRYVWDDKYRGGTLYQHLRQACKQRRKRYRSYDSRGRLAGKRHISQRPPGADNRSRLGHWEIDTVVGTADQHCIVTLVERKYGYTLIGKLKARTKEQASQRILALLRRDPELFRTLTADNGTEFHDYARVEALAGVTFYFATPYHSWERGTGENTNGLIRQYLPKGTSMREVTQHQCNSIAEHLNTRPRKRLGFRTPRECTYGY